MAPVFRWVEIGSIILISGVLLIVLLNHAVRLLGMARVQFDFYSATRVFLQYAGNADMPDPKTQRERSGLVVAFPIRGIRTREDKVELIPPEPDEAKERDDEAISSYDDDGVCP